MVKLSVIIACFNGEDTIGVQLEALSKQYWHDPWEIILADNGSTDNTLGIVESYRQRLPNLRIINASKRRGKSFALNVGSKAAISENLLFCDADDEVGAGWLFAMGEALSQHDFIACSIDIEKLNGSPKWAHPQRDGLQILPFPPNFPHAGGGTLGVKRWLHETVGGFDEDLHAHEDTFYCVKIHLQGTDLHFVPNAVLHWRLRKSSREIYSQAHRYGYYYTLLYKKCRALGTPKMEGVWKEAKESWIDILRRVARIRSMDHGRNLSWDLTWDLGYRIGRLKGSIVHRVFAF